MFCQNCANSRCSKCGNQLETVRLPWTKTKITLVVILGIICSFCCLIIPWLGLKYMRFI